MVASSTKSIDWDYILDSYGSETKLALIKLLNEAKVEEDEPAAVVMAAMFISQIETNKAFGELSKVIDQSKEDLSAEFKDQIITLRGIISFAHEHIVEGGQQEIEKRQNDLLNVVKQGITAAIGNQNRNSSVRNARFYFGAVAATFIVSVISLVVGAGGAFIMQPKSNSGVTSISKLSPDNQALIEWSQTQQGQIWLNIVNANSDRLQVCLANKTQLDNKCSVTIP